MQQNTIFKCCLCDHKMILLMDIGKHFRLEHPEDKPKIEIIEI